MSAAPLLPGSGVPDPRDAPPIRWGVLGPGGIANAFAEAVHSGTRSRVVAVGSRDLGRARAYADRHGVSAAYGSYEELVADDAVDAVYVASPHSEHRDHALLAVAAGRHVLVEKAFARSGREAREVIDAARARGVLAVEAMWSRYLPHYDVVARSVADGVLGDVVGVAADHGQPLYPDGPLRLAAPHLAGGALLDLGVYAVSFADHVLGGFETVTASGALTAEGVDSAAAVLVAANGAHGMLHTTMLTRTPCTARVVGSEATLELDGRFYAPTRVRLVSRRGDVLDERPADLPDGVHGFSYEAAEVARCVAAGALDSGVMPQAATLRVMDAMDEVRRQVGVRYPGE